MLSCYHTDTHTDTDTDADAGTNTDTNTNTDTGNQESNACRFLHRCPYRIKQTLLLGSLAGIIR